MIPSREKFRSFGTELLRQFLIAAIALLVAGLARKYLLAALEWRIVWVTFYPAVVVAAVLGGWMGGLFATAGACLIALFGWPLFVNSPFLSHPADWLGLYAYVFNCLLIVGTAQLMHRERSRALSAQEQAERVNAQKALRESGDRYKAILQTSLDGFLVMDAQGRITETNKAYSDISGYRIDELVGMHLHRRVIDGTPEFIQSRFELLRRKGSARFESLHHRKDGVAVPLEVSGLHIPGEDERFVVFVRDLTQARADEAKRRTLEECIARQQRMDAIGRLAGGIAHDFNNMLGVIIGHLEIAAYDLPRDNPVQKDLHEALKASRRSAELTKQILTFARKQPVAHETIDLNLFAGPILKMLGRVLGENIQLEWKPSEQLWPIRMAPSQVDQILTNLCLNAKDAITGEGTIEVSTDNVVLEGESRPSDLDCPEGGYVRLRIRDTGSGMDAATASKIFEPFFTTKEVGKGTGLGLSMVEGIVKQAGGFVQVQSEPGTGTLFSLHFPRVQADDHGSSHASSSPGEAAVARTILLVEDEIQLLELTTSVLERMGYRVLAFGSPLEALRAAKEQSEPIDLLVSDVLIPGMSGPALLKEIHAVLPELPYLFVSGHPTEIVSDAGILADGVAFLQKPFTRNQLATKIREVLSGSSD